MFLRALAITLLLLAGLACSTPRQPSQLKSSSSAAFSGAELYTANCASCHGADGKGSGPVASKLKVPPPDLTVLAQHNRGKFPHGDVYQIIKWGGGLAVHGSSEMPVWGMAFKSASKGDESDAISRIKALTQYIESIQIR